MHLRPPTSARLLAVLLLAFPAQTALADSRERTVEGKTLEQWISSVQDETGSYNKEAISALQWMGTDARAAIPVLARAVQSKDDDVAIAAVFALGRVGLGAPEAVPPLIDALKMEVTVYPIHPALYSLALVGDVAIDPLLDALGHEEERIRMGAALALRFIGEPAFPKVAERLKHRDPHVRNYAIFGLIGMNRHARESKLDFRKTFPALREALKDPDREVRRSAALALCEFGVREPAAAPILAEALKDKDLDTRKEAAEALARLGPQAKDALPALIEAIDDEDSQIRDNAHAALGGIGPDAEKAVPALQKRIRTADRPYESVGTLLLLGRPGYQAWQDLLASEDKATRRLALGGTSECPLADMGEAIERSPGREAVLKPLKEALADEDPVIRSLAASGLVGVGRDSEEIRRLLIDRLREDPDPDVRQGIAFGFRHMVPPPRPAISALLAALDDESEDVRDASVWTFKEWKLRDKELAEPLREIFRTTEHQKIRSFAADALARLDPPVVGPVIGRLSDADPVVRRDACDTLYDLGPKAGQAVGPLTRLLGDEDPKFRIAAASVLAKVKPDDRKAVDALAGLLKDREVKVRKAAAYALGQIGPPAHPAVPDLVAALKDDEAEVRGHAAYALGQIGSRAARAGPDLLALFDDKDGSVRRAAVRAVGQVHAEGKEVVPRLTALLDGTGPVLSAAIALGELGPRAKEAVDPLADLLACQDFETPTAAARALGNIGVANERVLRRLRALRDDPRFAVRDRVFGLSPVVTADAATGVDYTLDVFQLLDVGEWDPNKEAARALEKLDPEGEEKK